MTPDIGFRLIHQLSKAHVGQLHALYQQEWWTDGRCLEDVRTMLVHSDFVFGLCEPGSERLIGFARVLSDRVYKALIFDVIVATEARGRGVGQALMRAVLGHPDLRMVRHFELYCVPDMEPFYRQFGFTAEVSDVRLLRRDGRTG